MVIDTSAIFAAIANEPDAEVYRNAIKTAPVKLISALTLLETRIVLFSRLGMDALDIFDRLIESAGILVVPLDNELSNAAFDAFSPTRQGTDREGATEHCGLRRLRSGPAAKFTFAVQR